MRRALFLAVVGLGGAAILIALGVWQVQRLTWKETLIGDIDARLTAPPVAVPEMPDPARDAYLPVTATGTLGESSLRVLVSQKEQGAGYRIITPLHLEDRSVLLDRGFIPVSDSSTAMPQGSVTVTGNLQWPAETDRFTPAPDIVGNIWFARDVPAMADNLGTTPVLIVAREISPVDPAITPLPVDTTRIPNDHLQYAITWFSLAVLWLAMSVLFVLRRRAPLSKGPT